MSIAKMFETRTISDRGKTAPIETFRKRENASVY